MLKLYYAPGTCSLASHIALAEAGADYEAQRVDMASTEQRSDAYLAINPKGRVPVLITDDGPLSETVAILSYIAQRWPQAKLAPLEDAFALAQLQSFNAYLASTVHVAQAHVVRGTRWADDPAALEAMKAKAPSNIVDCFTLMETKMFKGPWVMGDGYTVADPYLFTVSNWLDRDKIDRTQFPKLNDHFERMKARPAVQKVLAEVNA